MEVTIPNDKQQKALDLLQSHWGIHRRSFTLRDAASLLGNMLSLCRVCKWGIFLFTILLHEITALLNSNSRRLMQTREFQELTEQAARHPTDSSKYRFFSSKTAQAIWKHKAVTWIGLGLREELAFVTTVLSNPEIYKWASPIAHMIPRAPDFEIWQDACLQGAGGFSLSLRFWWALEWNDAIYKCTLRFLPQRDQYLLSINLLEYAALIIGLAAAILAWEEMPPADQPNHPIALLWTDNTSAASWTKKVAGLKGPQEKHWHESLLTF